MMDELISLKDAATLLKVSPSTVRRLFDQKKLGGVRTPGGHRKVSLREVEKLAKTLENDSSGITFTK